MHLSEKGYCFFKVQTNFLIACFDKNKPIDLLQNDTMLNKKKIKYKKFNFYFELDDVERT